MTNNPDRARFEHWAMIEGYTEHALRLDDAGEYQDNWLRDCWSAWQAAQAQPPAPADDAFAAFLEAVREHGTSGLGYRKALAAYDAAKAQPPAAVGLSEDEAVNIVKQAHIKAAGWTDKMIAEQLEENPDWNWGYSYGGEQAVENAVRALLPYLQRQAVNRK